MDTLSVLPPVFRYISRMKGYAVVLLVLVASGIQAQVFQTISSPQPMWVGARIQSLGGSNPAIPYDVNAMMINPASVGNVDVMPFTASTQRVLGIIDYLFMNGSVQVESPFSFQGRFKQNVAIGWAYANAVMNKNVSTLYDSGHIQPISEYSSGFDMAYLTGSTDFYDLYGFDKLLVGVGVKGMRSFSGSVSKTGFGIDLGAIGTYGAKEYGFDRVNVGLAIHNFLSTPFFSSQNDALDPSRVESYLPIQLLVGVKADLLDDRLSLLANSSNEGIFFGAEYQIEKNMFFRGSTNFSRLNLGTGIMFEHIVGGLTDTDYGLRLDMNYTQNLYPFDMEPNILMSFSVLGESRPQTPQIINPSYELNTRDKTVRLSGVGPKEMSLSIFNNNSISRTIMTDRYGNWACPKFPLKEGVNKIAVRSYSIDQTSTSLSDPIKVISDSKPPSQSVTIYPEGTEVAIEVEAAEELVDLEGKYQDRILNFIKQDAGWITRVPMGKGFVSGAPFPSKMETVTIQSSDKSGNRTVAEPYAFFVEIETPQDKAVHYREELRVLGKASKMVRSMTLNNNPVYIDSNYEFRAPVKLDPGKNKLTLAIIAGKEKEITYQARVLRLITFPDLTGIKEKREIEFLATLGVMDGDLNGNFYPNKEVTRRYVVRMIAKIKNLRPEKVSQSLFSDVLLGDPDAGYIQAAIQNGFIFAYPDGTFKPDRQLTMAETLFLLSNAGVIDDDQVSVGDRPVSRKELAMYLAYIPRFEVKIERLVDWEKGY